MDRLESLGNTLSQITLYDLKSMYNQAKNVVLNVSEMEAKVREATNDEPWGASSTLMQEIAQGTFNFQQFNEIMPCIYARFMEKEARQWRQIYKALQLLEYLVKHGSERVVDDARSHISTLKMLRNFHYIDDKGKDEGVNVRNRSRELAELLSDVDKIRAERRKAKANKHKYTGTGSDASGFGGGSRYGGFGSDSFSSGGGGGYSNDYASYGGGGIGAGSSSFRDDSRRPYEEYDAGDDENVSRSPHSRPRSSDPRGTPSRKASTPASAPTATSAPPIDDLLGGFDDTPATTSPSTGISSLATNKALPAVAPAPNVIDDDEFADFQAAPVQAALTATSNVAPASNAAVKPNLMDLLASNNSASIRARPQANPSGAGFGGIPQAGVSPMAAGPASGMGGMHRSTGSLSQTSAFSSPLVPQSSVQMQHTPSLFGSAPIKPSSPTNTTLTSTSARPASAATQTKPSANFDDLWSLSLGTSATKSTPGQSTAANKSIKDLEREKAMAGLWGNQRQAGANITSTPGFGSGTGTFGNSSKTSGGDDLLL